MGKPRHKAKGRKGRSSEDALHKLNMDVGGLGIGEGGKKKKKKMPDTVEECLERGNAAMDKYDMEDAYKFVSRALELDENNVPALETMGTILCERGDVTKAKEIFENAIRLSPEKGFEKYMTLAQLVEGEESVKNFSKGIEMMQKKKNRIMRGELEEGENEGVSPMNQLEELQSDLCRGHLSVAEIYLTDLCESDNAPNICKNHLDSAIQTKPSSAEAHQLLASWCISMMDDDEEEENKFEEAKKSIETSVGLWLPQYQKATAEENDDDISGPSTAASLSSAASTTASFDPVQPCPLTVEDRINASKILIELFMMRQEEESLARLAVEILDTILDEDEDNIFVWYLLGWIGCMQGKEHYINSKNSLEQALLIGKKKGFVQSGSMYGVDKEQIESVLEELTKKIADEDVQEEDDDEEDIREGEDLDETYETDEE